MTIELALTPIEGALKIISLYRAEIIKQGAKALTSNDVNNLLTHLEEVLRK